MNRKEGFRVREKRRMNMTGSGLREENDGQDGFRVWREEGFIGWVKVRQKRRKDMKGTGREKRRMNMKGLGLGRREE